MGLYVNSIRGTDLPVVGKVKEILRLVPEAQILNAGKIGEIFGGYSGLWEPELVCVVSNPTFEAAAWAYNEIEMQAFNRTEDPRPRAWIRLPGVRNFVAETTSVIVIEGYVNASKTRGRTSP